MLQFELRSRWDEPEFGSGLLAQSRTGLSPTVLSLPDDPGGSITAKRLSYPCTGSLFPFSFIFLHLHCLLSFPPISSSSFFSPYLQLVDIQGIERLADDLIKPGEDGRRKTEIKYGR
jgi:hypothetical protein